MSYLSFFHLFSDFSLKNRSKFDTFSLIFEIQPPLLIRFSDAEIPIVYYLGICLSELVIYTKGLQRVSLRALSNYRGNFLSKRLSDSAAAFCMRVQFFTMQTWLLYHQQSAEGSSGFQQRLRLLLIFLTVSTFQSTIVRWQLLLYI